MFSYLWGGSKSKEDNIPIENENPEVAMSDSFKAYGNFN